MIQYKKILTEAFFTPIDTIVRHWIPGAQLLRNISPVELLQRPIKVSYIYQNGFGLHVLDSLENS